MIATAVAGTGNWGKNLVRTFQRLEDSGLRWLCDSDQRALEAAGRGCPGVRLTGDFAELLRDDALEAVALATPAESHYRLARAALEAGKHVFVEKPLALSAPEAEELERLSRERDRVLMVGHLLIYHPAVTALKAMVDTGELGKIFYIHTQRVNLGVVRRDENALWSLGPHDLSIILELLGCPPVEVTARGACYLRPGIEDVVFLTLRFADGAMAHVQLSWLDPHKERKVTVVGSRKMVVFDDMQAAEKLRVYDKGVSVSRDYASYTDLLTLREGDILIPQLRMEEPLQLECRHFLDCVAGRAECRSSGRAGVAVVRVLQAATESLRRAGEPVPIREESHAGTDR